MTNQEKNQKIAEAFRKFTRRDMLRTSSIATAGVVLMPSFIPGCRKWDMPNPGGNGGEEETPPINYAAAAVNLANMRAWIIDLYPMCIEYENSVFLALDSTTGNPNWKEFLVNIFIDVAMTLAEAAAAASGNPEVIPAIACMSAFLKDWGLGNGVPNNLTDEFAVFESGHVEMQKALEQKLSSLEDATDDYINLKTAWNDPIEFNGKNYTVGDLASSHFPTSKEGDLYNPLQSAAILSFQKMLWNLAIMKCCSFYRNYDYHVTTEADVTNVLLKYLRETYYPQNKGQYVRATLDQYDQPGNQIQWSIYAYNLGIDGYPFPDVAAGMLFMDDTPDHIINPKGLFNRSYVFQQFSVTKPYFEYGHEIGQDDIGDLHPEADDWDFTAGYFPGLIKI